MSIVICVNHKCGGVTFLETIIFDTTIDNENNLADVAIDLKYSCCSITAGLKACGLGVIILDVNGSCGGL